MCEPPASVRWRAERRRDSYSAAHSPRSGRRSLWVGRSRAFVDIWCASGLERCPWRAAHARRLRHFLALHALAHRPISLALGVARRCSCSGSGSTGPCFNSSCKANEELRIKNSLLIGFGLTLVLHALAIRFWTADEHAVTTDYAGPVIRVGGFVIPLLRLSSLLLAQPYQLAG